MEENLKFNRLTFITYFYLFFAFHINLIKLESFCKIYSKENNQFWTNCSNLELSSTSINISVSTTHLSLSNNVIKTIKPGNFENSKNLTYLDISNNLLKMLHPASFIGLTKLTILNISRNDLSSSSSFPIGVFKPLSLSLLELDIRHNLIDLRITNMMYPDEALADLHALKVLKIDCITGERFYHNLNIL